MVKMMRKSKCRNGGRRYTAANTLVGLPLTVILICVSSQITRGQQTSTQESSGVVPATSQPSDIPSAADGRYRIGPGDVIDVRVFGWPQFSREGVRIDERGMMLMPLLKEEVMAGCRTEAELSQEIATLYLKFLKNPQVDVFVKEYSSQPVAVIGAVNSPGRFQLRRQVRLLDLLSYAGGPSVRAGRSVQIIHANSPSICDAPKGGVPTAGISQDGEQPAATGPLTETFALSDMLRGDERANPHVRPGDLVTILEADQAFIIGNVLRPMTIDLKDPITVRQAIAMAGGALPDTKSDKIRILRQTPTGKQEITVDLKAIDKRGAEDVALQVNDIVEVPVSGGKRMLSRIAGAIAPAAALIPIRIIR